MSDLRLELDSIKRIEQQNGGRNPDALLPRLWRKWLEFLDTILGN
jgi:hypothetical protein